MHDGTQISDTFAATQQVGHFAHHFEAVVFFGVVRRRHHHARQPELGTGIIKLIGTHQADFDDIGPLVHDTPGYRIENRWTRQTHIVTDDDFADIEIGHKGAPNGVGAGFVELGGVDATNVVGFENSGINVHRYSLFCLNYLYLFYNSFVKN